MLGAAALGALSTRQGWSEVAQATSPTRFHFAVVADPHIIDEFYVKGSENGAEDNESILHTTERLISARSLINSLQPKIEQVFVAGDCFHNYPSTDYDFYFKHKTRIDNAKELFDGFEMPVHLGFGNHDYDVPKVSREMSHRLFAAKLKAKPYSSVDYKGFPDIDYFNANNESGDMALAAKYFKAAGYASHEEFIMHVLEKEIAKFDDAKSDADITEKLKGLGYNTIGIANAATRTGTAVQCKPGYEREAQVLATNVGNNAKVEAYPGTTPTGAESANCLVILGK